MTRLAVLIATSLTLASCAKPSGPEAGPIEPPAPPAPDPRLCAPVPPEPPVEGSIIAPATAEEAEAVRRFLNGEAVARAWGRDLEGRARLTVDTVCRSPPRPREPG